MLLICMVKPIAHDTAIGINHYHNDELYNGIMIVHNATNKVEQIAQADKKNVDILTISTLIVVVGSIYVKNYLEIVITPETASS